MDWETGRMTHIEDVLNKIGQDEKRPVWFTWTDSNHKIWENLVIIGNYAKPSKEHLESELARYQAEHDAQAYARKRKLHYPEIGDQLDI